ncbi:hypothetical protein [Mesorhizobium sp. L2C067A000]|uniref:hypothetical protein n=1 Tax=Mesorhizobium sp. L2C067A000 TaxID=1287106 RepID=UPI001FD8D410|nr:hypothetical protein [Mesorhizobium sp. L2C067A000]
MESLEKETAATDWHRSGGNGKRSPHPSIAAALTPQEKWRLANPLARWAHIAVQSALKRGLLAKQDCAVCGISKTDFHHDPDHYDRPLDGVWLCRKHHKGEHRRLKCEAVSG